MTTAERIEKAKTEARQKEAVVDMLEVMFKEIENRKLWYTETDEVGDPLPMDKMRDEWNVHHLKALKAIEEQLLKLL